MDMATNGENNLTGKCLLVSDSREVGDQYDSKRLPQENLVEMAQEALYKTCLDMGRYLARVKFDTYKQILEGKLEALKNLKLSLPVATRSAKLKVVEGQVIFVDKERFDAIQPSMPIEDYIKSYWNVPVTFTLERVSGCALRGVTGDVADWMVKRPTNCAVELADENMPPHMHHSAIEVGSGSQSLGCADSEQGSSSDNKVRYDIFLNGSRQTGLTDSGMDGVGDLQFQPRSIGENGTVLHDNMPAFTKFYVFVVKRA